MTSGRMSHTATFLPDGHALVAGGYGSHRRFASTEFHGRPRIAAARPGPARKESGT